MADVASGAGFMDYGQVSENGQTDNGQTGNSSNIDIKFKSPVAVRDVLAVSIARQQSAAANGRLFCVMAFCVCLLLWLFSPDNFFLWLAMCSTLPVAGAVVADNLTAGLTAPFVAGQVQSQPGNTASNLVGNAAGNASSLAVEPAAASLANPHQNSSGWRARGALHAALCGINTGVPVAVFILILLNIG
jgi:hypothetical protein